MTDKEQTKELAQLKEKLVFTEQQLLVAGLQIKIREEFMSALDDMTDVVDALTVQAARIQEQIDYMKAQSDKMISRVELDAMRTTMGVEIDNIKHQIERLDKSIADQVRRETERVETELRDSRAMVVTSNSKDKDTGAKKGLGGILMWIVQLFIGGK